MTPRYTRRDAFSLLGLTALGVGFGLRPEPAAAARSWCRTDPIFLVDGKLVDVTVGSDLAMLTRATGPINLVMTVPVGSTALLSLGDLGFGRGYQISFATSSDLARTRRGTQIRVDVLAPASGSPLPVQVFYTSLNLLGQVDLRSATFDGQSNAWVTAR